MKNYKLLVVFLLICSSAYIYCGKEKDTEENISENFQNQCIFFEGKEKLNIVLKNLKDIILNNTIFNPLNGIKEYIDSIADQEIYKKSLIETAKIFSRKHFIQEKINSDLKKILENYSPENEIIAAMLIIEGADPNISVNFKVGTQNYTLPVIIMISITNKFKKLVPLLASYGADLNYKLENNGNALKNSIILGYDDISKMLIDNGADLNIKDKEGNTPLMVAVIRNKENIVKELISHGADVNVKGEKGYTALMWAVNLKRTTIIKDIIESGANVSIINDQGLTARDIAFEKGYLDIYDIIFQVYLAKLVDKI
ncbi:ankyrin repeat domain-containing protein [Candidatus Babela massiliensis]|uniref:Ankyrin repeats containing protein n=1 Tax=Candidatus Babela massiliensis TaxID=673862 RepID=V6DGX4_9BACT|nr:ankyrin repeat domain-containing protein [Candidatus Babela massiliensis]CDK30183.1 Ankyrin repeats containing protein [Candidatus Babela massiliensis]